jgi:hypothetical protein
MVATTKNKRPRVCLFFKALETISALHTNTKKNTKLVKRKAERQAGSTAKQAQKKLTRWQAQAVVVEYTMFPYYLFIGYVTRL